MEEGQQKPPSTTANVNGGGKHTVSVNGPKPITTTTTVCVTGGSGFIASWLVKRLLEKGYYVRATVRDPGNEKKVKHLVELPNAKTHLSLWKADLTEDGSFDDAIQGCQGVFHVATPPDFIPTKDPENDLIKPTVNGMLSILRSCTKAKTVKRLVYTSTMATITVGPQQPPAEYDESLWTDVDFCRLHKMPGWTYFVGKTSAEKAAWSYAEQNGLDLVTIHPCFVIGPLLAPFKSLSIEVATALYAKNEFMYPMIKQMDAAVHVNDVCNAHIFLFENPLAKGRYICASHSFNLFELVTSLSKRYPDSNIQIEDVMDKLGGFDKSQKVTPCSSKKLIDLGFQFAYKDYTIGELCAEAIESCKEKGLLEN